MNGFPAKVTPGHHSRASELCRDLERDLKNEGLGTESPELATITFQTRPRFAGLVGIVAALKVLGRAISPCRRQWSYGQLPGSWAWKTAIREDGPADGTDHARSI
jgi:hypothetical protein